MESEFYFRPSIGVALEITPHGRYIFWAHWRPDIMVPVDSPLFKLYYTVCTDCGERIPHLR